MLYVHYVCLGKINVRSSDINQILRQCRIYFHKIYFVLWFRNAEPTMIFFWLHRGGFQVKNLLDSVKWDEKGLVVAIAQNADTGAVLMQGFANREALEATLSSRKATFYSRSRSSLWTKGETSSNFINVLDIFLDCDRDSVRLLCYQFTTLQFYLLVHMYN